VPGLGGPPSISVVLVCRDEPELAQTLEALQPQCVAAQAECLVIDGSETRLEDIAAAHPWVRWVDYVAPLGVRATIASQRNLGARLSRGAVVAYLDAGSRPAPGWLEALCAPVLDGRAAGTCGPVLPRGGRGLPPLNDLSDGEVIEVLVTASFAISREVLLQLGGFDERYDWGEDLELGWRLEDAGYRVHCAAGGRVEMDWGDEARARRRSRAYAEGAGRHLVTHPGRAAWLLRRWPNLIVYPAGLLATPVVVAIGAVTSWWVVVAWGALASAMTLRILLRGELALQGATAVAVLRGGARAARRAPARVLVVATATERAEQLRADLALAEVPTRVTSTLVAAKLRRWWSRAVLAEPTEVPGAAALADQRARFTRALGAQRGLGPATTTLVLARRRRRGRALGAAIAARGADPRVVVGLVGRRWPRVGRQWPAAAALIERDLGPDPLAHLGRGFDLGQLQVVVCATTREVPLGLAAVLRTAGVPLVVAGTNLDATALPRSIPVHWADPPPSAFPARAEAAEQLGQRPGWSGSVG